MKSLIISCSHRKNSNSKKVGLLVSDLISQSQDESQLLDLGENPLALWDENVWNNSEQWQQDLKPLREAAQWCDSLVFIIPEYAGMASPAAKNIMLFLDSSDVGHKPAFLVGVSASNGGTYPVAEMRMSSIKNNRIIWIPDQVIIRYVNDFQKPFKNEVMKQNYIRIEYGIKLLKVYAEALKSIRTHDVVLSQPFPFAM